MKKQIFKTVKEAAEWLNEDFRKKCNSDLVENATFDDLKVNDYGFDYIKNNIEVEGKEMYLSAFGLTSLGDPNQYIVFFDSKDSSKFEVIEVTGDIGETCFGKKRICTFYCIAGREVYNYFYGPSKQLVNGVKSYAEDLSEDICSDLGYYLYDLRNTDGFKTAYAEYLIMQELREYERKTRNK